MFIFYDNIIINGTGSNPSKDMLWFPQYLNNMRFYHVPTNWAETTAPNRPKAW